MMDYRGPTPDKLNELEYLTEKCLREEPYVLICIVGNKGVGKSLLGRHFRKKGFGRYKPSDIAVIDDDCMRVKVLWFFRFKYFNPCKEIDELAPFYKYCKNKRIRFYIKSNPETRVSRASIVIKTYTSDAERLQRLIKRYDPESGRKLFYDSSGYSVESRIQAKYEIELPL